MSENIQKSPSLNQMVDDLAHLKQWLEYFERHVQNSNNEVKRILSNFGSGYIATF